MRVFTVRYPRKTVTDILLSLLCIFIIVLILQRGETINASAEIDPVEHISGFLSENGIDASLSDYDSEIFVLPSSFDETMREYNMIQLSQGFDLTQYLGREVTRYTFRVVNYSDFGDDSDSVFSCVYLHEGEIIAADVHSVALDGFMYGVVSDE